MRLRRSRPIRWPLALFCVAFTFPFWTTASFAVEDWAPPEPGASTWDWARIDSGEWLEGKRIYQGMGELRGGALRIRQADGESVEIPKDELVSITYSNEQELQRWSVKIGANLADRTGNTDQQDFGAEGLIRRDATSSRWDNRYNGAISKVDGDKTTNNHRASTMLDLMITNRFFVRIPYFEFYSDEFQSIAARYATGLGIGYEPIDDRFAEFRIAIGTASQVTYGLSNVVVALAHWLAFQMSIWHEIATWYGWESVAGFSERASAFSPEDIDSNMLGSKLMLAVAT